VGKGVATWLYAGAWFGTAATHSSSHAPHTGHVEDSIKNVTYTAEASEACVTSAGLAERISTHVNNAAFFGVGKNLVSGGNVFELLGSFL